MNPRNVELAVDILCAWGGYSPSYRIYVDNDLLTERTYVWDNTEALVREHIIVNLTPGDHTLTLEKCGDKWIWGEYKLANFTIDGKAAELVNNQFNIAE